MSIDPGSQANAGSSGSGVDASNSGDVGDSGKGDSQISASLSGSLWDEPAPSKNQVESIASLELPTGNIGYPSSNQED